MTILDGKTMGAELTELNKPRPFRTLRALTSSILNYEELRRKAPEGSEERWRIERKLADLGRQLDEAEGVWLAHNRAKAAP
jgi:hypothetical protein